MKWVSTVSNNLLFETGVSAFFLHYKTGYQPEVGDSDMAKIDFVKSTLTNAVVRDYDSYAQRQTYTASMSYVTGAHNFKTGLQYGVGPYKETVTINGDRVLRFRDGVPDSVDVYNSPLEVKESLNVDVGIYAQDTWTVKRATINAGVRLEHFNTSIDAQASGAGTFVPARSFAEIGDVPNWTDIVPRFGIAYDLFGDSRSAIKVSASKYMGSEGVGLAHTVNPMFTSQDRRSWTDTNGNGEAELSEIGPSTGFRGGVNQRIDPEITRPYNWEYSASFQQQLPARLTMSVAYYKRNVRNLYGVKNQLVTSADYTALSITNPVTGDPLTIYNLDPAKANLVDLLVSNYGELDKDYNGVEIRADKRFNNSAMLFGGVTIGKKYGFDSRHIGRSERSEPFDQLSRVCRPRLDGSDKNRRYLSIAAAHHAERLAAERNRTAAAACVQRHARARSNPDAGVDAGRRRRAGKRQGRAVESGGFARRPGVPVWPHEVRSYR